MKRIVLSVIALSMLAVPAAQAQTRSNYDNGSVVERQYQQPRHEVKPGFSNGHAVRRPIVKQPRFERGHRYTKWKRQQQVRDWQRHGLRRPGHGQQWVKVGNDYLLITIASGIIAGLIAGR